MSENFKFEVGTLVKINPEAIDEQLYSLSKITEICRTRLFTIADRKVHWYTIMEEQHSTNWYQIPGYDWHGGEGWIDEAWLTKWNGSGQLQITVTLSSEGQTREEVECEAKEMLVKIQDIVEGLGMPREAISMVGIKYGDGPVIELDMVG